MNKQILKVIGGASLAILMLATFALLSVSANESLQDGNGGIGRTLVGSWDVQVTSRDCQTGAAFFSFPAMTTYHQGGTMQETDLGGPGLVRLPAHGVWERQNGRQFTASFRFLNFAPDRTFVGTSVIRSSITLSQSGNEYTSTDTLEVLDANGTVIGGGCGTETATRFE